MTGTNAQLCFVSISSSVDNPMLSFLTGLDLFYLYQ